MRTPRYVLAMAALACSSAVWSAESTDAGKTSFGQNCAVCHQLTGAGNPALAPPLLVYPARYATRADGRRQLVMTLLYGLYGDIVVDDKHYNFKMPSFSQLDDAVLAEILNYVVFELGKAPPSVAAFTASDVAEGRAAASSGAEVRAHRSAVLQALGL